MKILQLNAWSCFLAPEIVKLFQRERPDIVCLQEVISAERTGKILQSIEEILEEYSFEHQYYSPLVEFRFMHSTAQRGNMILSRHPIVSSETFWTKGGFVSDFDRSVNSWNDARGVACCIVKTPIGSVNILTTHGYHVPEHKNGNDQTFNACSAITEYAANLEGTVVITGDFNLAPHSSSIEVLNARFRNLCVENDVQTTRNHLTHKSEVCDYIFIDKVTEVQSFSVLNDIVSDHKALLLTI